MQFQSDWAKTEVCIKPTMFHRQSANGNLNLWLCGQKSIGFLLSWWWTYVWSLKVIRQKYKSISRLQGKVLRNHARTQSRMYSPNHTRTAALIYHLQRFFEGKMSWGYYFYFSKNLFSTNLTPVGTPGVQAENTSSVSPACRKRRLNGAPFYSHSRWYGVKQ